MKATIHLEVEGKNLNLELIQELAKSLCEQYGQKHADNGYSDSLPVDTAAIGVKAEYDDGRINSLMHDPANYVPKR